MKKLSALFIALVMSGAAMAQPALRDTSFRVDISGIWNYRLDPEDRGVEEKWCDGTFEDKLHLPGALHTQGIGEIPGPSTRWLSGELAPVWRTHPMYEKYRSAENFRIFDFLLPERQYTGPVWYSRDVDVPGEELSGRVTLTLERVHWQSTLYVNGRKVGDNLGLGTSHIYDVTGFLREGTNRISIRVNNDRVVDVGRIPHSISEQTMSAWNGIIGKMFIESAPAKGISGIQIFPDLDKGAIRVEAEIYGPVSNSTLSLRVHSYDDRDWNAPEMRYELSCGGDSTVSVIYPMGDFKTWDEYSPSLYRLEAALEDRSGTHRTGADFGMREVSVDRRYLILNGHRVFVRGNLVCGEAPLDGLPSTDVEWWMSVLRKHSEWGQNTVRFHSWCPPEAAFQAADRLGIYLQAEAGEWARVSTPEQRDFILDELDRMISQYGNHPSFIFVAMGNELSCDRQIMQDFARKAKSDGRRWVTGKVNGLPVLPEFDFFASRSVNRNDKLGGRLHVGWPPTQKTNLVLRQEPSTDFDYGTAIEVSEVPFISHEVGQYCVYPDYPKERLKYTGVMNPTVLDIQADQVAERGMEDQVSTFSQATGLWQTRLYKAEFEALLRTPSLAGFHMLSLQDFPGQCHAPVGVLDCFWDPKGHVTPDEFKSFCNDRVILARIKKQVLTRKDTLAASFEVFNFSDTDIEGEMEWAVQDEKGRTICDGRFDRKEFPCRVDNAVAGSISIPLSGLNAPARYTLSAGLVNCGMKNEWDFWVFQSEPGPQKASSVLVCRHFDDECRNCLEKGGTVLLMPAADELKGGLPTCFGSIYWTSFGTNGGETMCNSILCDPAHPLFRHFPTGIHTDWQWWDILTHTVPVILDGFGEENPFPKTYRPLIQAIDSWKINRKLAILAEGRMGRGKIMICGIDFDTDMDDRPASRQLYKSLLEYMGSRRFRPGTEFTPEMVMSIFGQAEQVEAGGGSLPSEG